MWLLAGEILFIPNQPRAVQQHRDVIEDIASQDAAFLIADEKSPSKNSSEKNQIETRDVGKALSAVKTHDLISCI